MQLVGKELYIFKQCHQEKLHIQNTSMIDKSKKTEKKSNCIYLGLSTGEKHDLVTSNLWKSASNRGGEIHTLPQPR